MTLQAVAIRDNDLLEQVASANEFGRDFILRRAIAEQERRDRIAAMSRDERRRALLRKDLEAEAPDRDTIRHLHSTLAICSLPYRQPEPGVREWNRKQGRMQLSITAGKLMSPETGQWVDQPLPYGSRARLLMLHICSEAIRQKSATISIEDSLTGFIRNMGFSVTGGKNGTLAAFKQQVNSLAACNMRLGVWDGDRARTINTQPFSSIEVWFPVNPNERMLWPSTITLSHDFYTNLVKHALPVNYHAVRVFAASPRKLDLLFWLGYRVNGLTKTTTISWAALKEQFGFDIARERRFRAEFAEDIKHIKEVFPKLPVALSEHGFTISPGGMESLALPAIPRK